MALDKKDKDLLAFKAAKTPVEKRKYADKLVRANIALIRKLVYKYSRHLPLGVDEEDAMQAGMIGFLRTLEKTDPARKFSTLCAYWIRYEIGRMANKSRCLLLPNMCSLPYSKLKWAEDFYTQHGRHPTAKEMDVTQYKYDKWREATQMPPGPSLDAQQAGKRSLHEILVSDDVTPDAALDHRELLHAVAELPLLERRIIEMTFLQDRPAEEVAEELGVSEEAVVQVQDTAMELLRDALE